MATPRTTSSAKDAQAAGADPRTVPRDSADNPDTPDKKLSIGEVVPDNVLVDSKGEIENIAGVGDILRNINQQSTTPLIAKLSADLQAGLTQPGQEKRLIEFEQQKGQLVGVRLKLDPNEQAVDRPKHHDDLLIPALQQTAQTKRVHALYMTASPVDPPAIDQKVYELEFLKNYSGPLRTQLKMIDARISILEQDLYQMGAKAHEPIASAIGKNAVLTDNLPLLDKLIRGDAQTAADRRKENESLIERTREETIAEMASKEDKGTTTPETKVSVSTTPPETAPKTPPAAPTPPKGRGGKKK